MLLRLPALFQVHQMTKRVSEWVGSDSSVAAAWEEQIQSVKAPAEVSACLRSLPVAVGEQHRHLVKTAAVEREIHIRLAVYSVAVSGAVHM